MVAAFEGASERQRGELFAELLDKGFYYVENDRAQVAAGVFRIVLARAERAPQRMAALHALAGSDPGTHFDTLVGATADADKRVR